MPTQYIEKIGVSAYNLIFWACAVHMKNMTSRHTHTKIMACQLDHDILLQEKIGKILCITIGFRVYGLGF
jgi:hypothetical protein